VPDKFRVRGEIPAEVTHALCFQLINGGFDLNGMKLTSELLLE
jgi:hypothetical protein